jgi:GNAT superfamily N-acetyltransferase
VSAAADVADRVCAIRPARPAEADALTELGLRAKAVWGYDAAFLARCRTVMTVKAGNIATRPHYVAETAGRLAGFYGLEPDTDGIGLGYMFVEPDLIGRGIGRALWQHATTTARTLGHPALLVVSDPNAEGFYLKMGCRRIGTRPSELDGARRLPLLRFALA